MIININNEKEIMGYAMTGELGESIQFDGIIPDEFYDNFKPRFYLFKNNQIIINPNYSDSTIEAPTPTGPTTEQLMINQLGLQVATLTKTVTKLQGGATDE